jgi:hypothetical protein
VPTAQADAFYLTADPGRDIWFAEYAVNKIARLTL